MKENSSLNSLESNPMGLFQTQIAVKQIWGVALELADAAFYNIIPMIFGAIICVIAG